MTTGSRLAKAFSITHTTPQFSGVNGQISHMDGELTRAGMKVSPEGALRIAAVWIANTLIADEVSSLAYKIVRKDDTTRVPTEPPELRPLWARPNSDQVTMDWLATNSLSLTLWGVSYNMLGWLNSGELATMWPVDPGVCSLERMDDMGLRLKATGLGELENHPEQRPQFMMIPLFRLPGRVEPVSPVKYAAELLGLSAAYDATAASLMGRGMNPTAVVTADEFIEDEQASSISRRLEKLHGGPERAGGVAVVGGKGLKLERLTMSMVDAQFVAQRQDVFALAMALWRVPPTVAGMADKPSTWGTGIAEFSRGLERFTLRPIVNRFQAGFEANLTRWVDSSLQVRFKFDSLMSASPKERSDIQRLNLASGITSVERVLAQNDDPPFGEDETVFSQLALATDEDRRLQQMRNRADAYVSLVRAGVAADAAAEATGFDPNQLTGGGFVTQSR